MQGSCSWPNPEEVHLGAAFRQDHSLSTLWHVQGSSASVPDAGQLLQQVQGQLQAAWPQLQTFMDMPGAIEMRAELLASLSRRFFARTIKMILGPQVILLWYQLRHVCCCIVPTTSCPMRRAGLRCAAQHALFLYQHSSNKRWHSSCYFWGAGRDSSAAALVSRMHLRHADVGHWL